MKSVIFTLVVSVMAVCQGQAQPTPENAKTKPLFSVQEITAKNLRINQNAIHSTAFERLEEMCDRFGSRPAGSTNLEGAIDWIIAEMRKDGLSVKTEEVILEAWKRGAEGAEIIEPKPLRLHPLGLGGTVPTPPGGTQGELVVVESLGAVKNHPDLTGKIVLINQPFVSYGETVAIRARGAVECAKKGAIACLIRSVTPFSMQTAHTGRMNYVDGVPKIPAAALTVEETLLLARMTKRGQKISIKLSLQSEEFKTTSRNVIVDLPGREFPEEIVLIGAHIDSWDVGQGAMDDGGGCVAVWEALKIIKNLELRPRRTIRMVLWTNEENGIDGAMTYHSNHKSELPNLVAALETDEGVFKPLGFNLSGSPSARARVKELLNAVQPEFARELGEGSSGTDLIPLREAKVPTLDLVVERERYFWYHHSEADTVDKLDRNDFNQCVSAIATLAYGLAEMKEPLPR